MPCSRRPRSAQRQRARHRSRVAERAQDLRPERGSARCMSRSGIPRSISSRSSTAAATSAAIARARSTCLRSSVSARLRSCAAARLPPMRPGCARCAIACGRRCRQLDGIHLNGPLEPRLPNNLNVRVDDVHGESLLKAIAGDVAVSSGAACATASAEPSHVLRAMGLSDEAGARVDQVRSRTGSPPSRRSTRPRTS